MAHLKSYSDKRVLGASGWEKGKERERGWLQDWETFWNTGDDVIKKKKKAKKGQCESKRNVKKARGEEMKPRCL